MSAYRKLTKSMKKILLIRIPPLILFTLFLNPSKCQTVNFEWVKAFGESGYEQGVGMVVDSNKYIITTGFFAQTVDFDPGAGVFNLTANSSSTIYLSKIDTAGNFIWAKKIGGNVGDCPNSMTNDLQGNIYITGYFQGTVDFDPGPGVYNLSAIGGTCSFIVKLDNDGNFIWAKQINTLNSQTINVDASNNVIIGGQFSGTVDFDPGPGIFNASSQSAIINDIYILKLDAAGNFIWMKQLKSNAGSANKPAGIKSDALLNIYITGIFENTMDFDPGTGNAAFTSFGLADVFILKLDQTGNYNWLKQMGGSIYEVPIGIELDATGNIYTSGSFNGTADFDPGSGTALLTCPNIFNNSFISKLDNNGNFIFAKQFTSNNSQIGINAMTLDWSNNIYITGSFGGLTNGTADFDPGPGTFTLIKGDIFIVKLDNSGVFKWAGAIIGITSSFSSYAAAIKTDILKNIYSTSAFGGLTDFDPGTTVFSAASNGNFDGYILKLSQCNNTLKNISVTTCGNYVLNGITYTSSGLYYQSLINAVGCDSIISLNLTIPVIRILVNASICQGQFYGPYGSSGLYNDTLTSVSGCDSIRTLNLVINPNPKPNLGKDTVLCTGKTYTLMPGRFNNYEWNDGTNGSTLTVLSPNIYWVLVKDNNNCAASDSITIKQATLPNVKATKTNDIDCIAIYAKLNVTGAQSYTWLPATDIDNINSPNPKVTPLSTTTYFVTGVDANGCENNDSVTVIVTANTRKNGFLLPNSFTPNGDGKNDCYGIKNFGSVQNIQFIVYNRWGEKVFSTNNPFNCWDGFYRGKRSEPGGYVYYIKAEMSCGLIEKKGSFILLR